MSLVLNLVVFLLCLISMEGNSIASDKLSSSSDCISSIEKRLAHLESLLQEQDKKFDEDTGYIRKYVKRLLVNDPSLMDQRISHLESLVQQQQKEIAHLKNINSQINGGGGAVFTRWGRKSCPNNTETIYSGLAAGGAYSEQGSGTDYLCLPLDPSPGSPAGTDYVNHLYGVEYETNFWRSDSHDEDAPCAVCRNPSQTTTMMIPGRNKCYAGWTFQYEGHIGSGYYGYVSSHNHVCVDTNPDYLRAGEHRTCNTNGAIFYPVITRCGTLQCSPYKNNLTVPCVVWYAITYLKIKIKY